MAIVTTNNAHYSDIAAKIREKTGAQKTYKPAEMPNGIDEVYEAGKLKEREGGFETVSLLTLQEQGSLTTTAQWGFDELTENTLAASDGVATINISGNVEISAILDGSGGEFAIDGNVIATHSFTKETPTVVEYTGKVEKEITIRFDFLLVTFDRFAVDYTGASEVYYESGYADGVEAGKQSEYNAFWNAYQDGGNRRNYVTGFAGAGWTVDTFKPKYNITPQNNSNTMFQGSAINGNLKDILDDLGVVLDLSNVTRFQYGFGSTKFTGLGIVNLSKADNRTTYVFYDSSSLVSIEKLVVSENNVTFANWFDGCTALTDITIEGTIANNFDIHWSTNLSAESLNSIVTHTTTTSTMTLTLPTNTEATYNAKYGAGEWAALVATRPNVSFAYA